MRRLVRSGRAERERQATASGASYKAQALFELALRLELEAKVEEMSAQLGIAIDLAEELEDEPISDRAAKLRDRLLKPD